MKDTWKSLVSLVVGATAGYGLSPALHTAGFTVLSAFSALLVVLLGWYFVGECRE